MNEIIQAIRCKLTAKPKVLFMIYGKPHVLTETKFVRELVKKHGYDIIGTYTETVTDAELLEDLLCK